LGEGYYFVYANKLTNSNSEGGAGKTVRGYAAGVSVFEGEEEWRVGGGEPPHEGVARRPCGTIPGVGGGKK